MGRGSCLSGGNVAGKMVKGRNPLAEGGSVGFNPGRAGKRAGLARVCSSVCGSCIETNESTVRACLSA